MNIPCPVCRAENSAGPNCRRCKADLSLLIDVETARAKHISQAQIAISNDRLDEALDELNVAQGYRDGPDVRRLRACTFLKANDFAAAMREHALVPR